MTREEQIRQASEEYAKYPKEIEEILAFEAGAEWADEHPKPLWKDAQGEDLPEIDREVIVIDIRGKVSFGHRHDPNGFDCKNVDTGEIEHLEPMTYDNGGWNIPDVRWWLDLPLPEEKGGEE